MTSRSSTTKRKGSIFRVFGEILAELKKVVWLNRREVAYLTLLVLLASISVGIILGIIDFGFVRLINDLFLG